MRALLSSLVLGLSLTAFATPGAPAPAPKVKPAALQAVPTDAQCLALGPVISPFPLISGETLEYEIDALGARAGTMTMRTLPVRDGILPLEVEVETNTFFNKIRRVRGVAKSELSPKTARPSRYFEDSWENDVHRVAEVTFKKDHVAHLVSTQNNRTGQADLHTGNDVSDVASAVHLLRSLPLKEGLRLCFDVYGIRRIWRVWGTVLPREHVSTSIGEFESWHLKGQAAPVDIPNARREVHIWVSDDAKRLPLAAVGMIDLGAVRATLKGFSRPGEKTTRAENKGDIKW